MLTSARLVKVIRDAIASKRVIKWGYSRNFGGPNATSCDSVASHTAAVSVLSMILAYEYVDALEQKTGTRMELEDVPVLAIFHDIGEERSGDTGASSHAVRGICNLHSLEREGLVAVMNGLRLEEKVTGLFDDYRAYRTPEALIVHIADNIEGFEKGLSIGGESAEMAIRIFGDNVALYRGKHEAIPELGPVCDFVVAEILEPAVRALAQIYKVEQTKVDAIFG